MNLSVMIVVLQGLTVSQSNSPHPVVIVDDPQEVRRVVGRVEGIFTPSQIEAESPRRDLKRYLEAERRREKSVDTRRDLRRIGLLQDRYFWHCAGYIKGGQKELFCSFVRQEMIEMSRLRRKTFPTIYDGGISVCWCYFSLKLGRIIRLEWNGEA